MNAKQRWVVLIGVVLAGVAAFFPRDEYERLYVLFTRQRSYNAHDLIWLWIVEALIIAVLCWALSDGPRKPSRQQRWVLWLGAIVLARFALFPPNIYGDRYRFIFSATCQLIDPVLLSYLILGTVSFFSVLLSLYSESTRLRMFKRIVFVLGMLIPLYDTFFNLYGNFVFTWVLSSLLMGITIILGYAFMWVIDQRTRKKHVHVPDP